MKRLICLLCLAIFACSSAGTGTSIRPDSQQPLETNVQPIRELRTVIFYDEHLSRGKAVALAESCSANSLREAGISLKITDCEIVPLPKIRTWGVIENTAWGLVRQRTDYDIVITLTKQSSWGRHQGVIDSEYRRFITLKGFEEPLLRNGIYHAFIFKEAYLKPEIYSKDPGDFGLDSIPFSSLKSLSRDLQREILQNKSRHFHRKIK